MHNHSLKKWLRKHLYSNYSSINCINWYMPTGYQVESYRAKNIVSEVLKLATEDPLWHIIKGSQSLEMFFEFYIFIEIVVEKVLICHILDHQRVLIKPETVSYFQICLFLCLLLQSLRPPSNFPEWQCLTHSVLISTSGFLWVGIS